MKAFVEKEYLEQSTSLLSPTIHPPQLGKGDTGTVRLSTKLLRLYGTREERVERKKKHYFTAGMGSFFLNIAC